MEREYYFNDAGGQMDRFGASVEARYLQALGRDAEVPEDGYHGEYVAAYAADIVREQGDALADLPPEERFVRLRTEGARRAMDGIRETLARFGVAFDTYVSEATLEERGEIGEAIDRLFAAGKVYEADGATWFRSTDYGDDKDRILVRSNGRHTYFGADCAYLIDKFRRGFDHLVYVWGADHHGDVVRVKGAADALGFDPNRVELMIYQFVAFQRGGEPLQMSKRAGTFVSLDELLDEVGADAARFHLLLFSNDHSMRFDIEEVAQRSMENPVYYVQYGHARIASIVRKAADAGIELRPLDTVDLSLLGQDAELELLRALADVPEVLARAAELRAPHRVAHAAQDIAARFHRFYTECRVVERGRGAHAGAAVGVPRDAAGAREPARAAGGVGARADGPRRCLIPGRGRRAGPPRAWRSAASRPPTSPSASARPSSSSTRTTSAPGCGPSRPSSRGSPTR